MKFARNRHRRDAQPELRAEAPGELRLERRQADLAAAVHRIHALRERIETARAVLVGVSGIEASGKGFLSAKIIRQGLRAADTIRAYEFIYWPAQRIHLERHTPHASADLIINNDPADSQRRFPV